MSVALTVAQYLNDHDVAFDVVTHPSTVSAFGSAEASHVPGERVAKAVVLRTKDGFVVAVLPASHRIQFRQLDKLLERHADMAKEEEIETLFADCDPGAVPPFGNAYGLKTVVDDDLAAQPEVYFEAGDHESLVHVAGPSFRRLVAAAPHGHFAERVQSAVH